MTSQRPVGVVLDHAEAANMSDSGTNGSEAGTMHMTGNEKYFPSPHRDMPIRVDMSEG